MEQHKFENKARVLVTLDRRVSERAKATGNRSALVNNLLRAYFNNVDLAGSRREEGG